MIYPNYCKEFLEDLRNLSMFLYCEINKPFLQNHIDETQNAAENVWILSEIVPKQTANFHNRLSCYPSESRVMCRVICDTLDAFVIVREPVQV